MAQTNPQTVADRWASNLGNAAEKIRSGVQSVQTSPTQSAAAKVATWQARIADPNTAARYVAGLQRVDLGTWQSAMINKGLPRISTGAQAAKGKFAQFLSQWLPFVANVQAQVKGMPNITLQDRINRMVQNATLLSGFKRS